MSPITANIPKPGTACFAALFMLLVLPACENDADRVERGQQAYESGDYRAAIIDAKNVLQNDPNNLDARLLLGRSSVQIGDPRSAEKELRRAVRLGASQSEVVVDLGQALLDLREFEQIEAEIKPVMAADEEARIAILRIRGNAFLAQQRVADARANFVEILAARNNDLGAMLAVVTSYVVQNEMLQARATLDQVLSIDPEYVAGWIASGSLAALRHNLGQAELSFAKAAELAVQQNDLAGQQKALTGVVEVQLAQGKAEEAKLTTATLAALSPVNPFNEYLAARVAFLEEDWTAAEEKLRIILQLSPEFFPARILMGAVQLKLGNLSMAGGYLSAVVAALPTNLIARKLLAEVHLQQNRAAQASQVLQPILDGESADAGAFLLGVRASLGTGDLDEAVRYLKSRAASEPDNLKWQMDLAAAQLSLGDVDAAQELLQDLPIISADDAYRREILLVLAEVRQENYGEALVAARKMQEQWPDDVWLQNLLGRLLDESGDRVAARQSYELARKLDSSDIVSLIYLARLDVNEGNFESANELYEQALQIQPQNAGILLSLGRVATFRGDSAAAITWLEKARNADKTNISSRLMLGKLYLTSIDFAAAEQAAREAIALNQNLAEAHNTLGQALSAKGEHESALEGFEQAIKLNPSEPGYSINLAREYVIGEEIVRAADVLFGLLQSKPDHYPTAIILADLFAQTGGVSVAIPAARNLQQQNPAAVGPKVLLAELYYASEQFDEGSDLYDEALKLTGNRDLAVRAYRYRATSGQAAPEAPLLKYISSRPEDAAVRMLLAQEYQAQGNNGQAAAEYRKVVDVTPNNPVALNNLAMIYFTQGNTQAEGLARKASELAPANAAIADTLGWILVRTGAVEEGVENLRKAAELAGESQEIRYHLAVGLVESGAADEARNLLSEILSADDSFSGRADAEALLSKL